MRAPSWQEVKGVLLHRCVLAAAGKPLTVVSAKRRVPDDDGGRVPDFVAEAQWLARRLTAALSAEDDETVWSLIDPGGPRWALTYSHYLALSPSDQRRALDGLEQPAVAAAAAILSEAARDGWEAILSEAIDPISFLVADKGDRLARADLLVRRPGRPPLVVDLKTGQGDPSAATMGRYTEKIAADYGHPLTCELDAPVACRALYVSFVGEHRWGRERMAHVRSRARSSSA